MDPSILFMIALIVALVAGVIGTAFSNWFLQGVATLVFGVALWLFAGSTILAFTIEHWPFLVAGAIGYVTFGILYALWRHWALVNSDSVQSLLKSGLGEWKRKGGEGRFKDSLYFPSSAMPNKREILVWIAWWPISIVFYFLGDVLRDIFVGIYNRIVGVFTAISDRAVRRAGGE